jgi:hypothetical protein
LLLAMGGYTILHGWLFGFVPGFGSMRAPARFVFLMSFALAALAALGLDALMRGPEEEVGPALRVLLRVAPWVIGAVALFAIPLAFYAVITSQDKDPVIFARTSSAANGLVFFAGLLIAGVVLSYLRQRGGLRPAIIGALALGVLFFDLVSLGSNVDVGYEDPTQGFDHPAIVGFLQSDPDLYRIDSRTDVWHLWQPNTGLLHGIFDVAGLINPLSLADYDRYMNAVPSRSSPLFDFLNAKYVIAAKDVTLDWEKFVPVFDADPALNVYLNREALPRAQVIHRAIAAPDREAAFAALHSPDFDPATTVVVEGPDPEPVEGLGPKLVEGGKALDVTPPSPAVILLETYGPNEIRLRVDAPADAYLVLSEVWYPGWRATVDGVPAQVLRANYAFRAVRLGPGQNEVPTFVEAGVGDQRPDSVGRGRVGRVAQCPQDACGVIRHALAWESRGDYRTTASVAWGDWDGDGDLDLAVGNGFIRTREVNYKNAVTDVTAFLSEYYLSRISRITVSRFTHYALLLILIARWLLLTHTWQVLERLRQVDTGQGLDGRWHLGHDVGYVLRHFAGASTAIPPGVDDHDAFGLG